MTVFNSKAINTTDDYGTPDYATELIVPYLKREWIIWEPCCGYGAIHNYLHSRGFNIFGTDIKNGGMDALIGQPSRQFDCVVTNPPYSLKTEFLERCYGLGKPFALLLPCDLVNKKRTRLMQSHGVQLIVPDKRIKFIRFDKGRQIVAPAPNMGSCWFTKGLDLPKDITFVNL
jgi:hypothetical protein